MITVQIDHDNCDDRGCPIHGLPGKVWKVQGGVAKITETRKGRSAEDRLHRISLRSPQRELTDEEKMAVCMLSIDVARELFHDLMRDMLEAAANAGEEEQADGFRH